MFGVASYAGGCEYPKSLRGALVAMGLQMSAVVAANHPLERWLWRTAFHLGECLESAVLSTPSVHVLCGVLFYTGGCQYPKSLCRRWCFVARVGDACLLHQSGVAIGARHQLPKKRALLVRDAQRGSLELVDISHLQ